MFGKAVCVEIKQENRLTQKEINNYYKTHTLLEAIRSFHHRPNKLNIDPELKKEDAGLGRPLALTRSASGLSEVVH
jgi:hypothetical protein